MKSKLAALLLASSTLGGGPAIFAPLVSAQAQVEVSFEFFRDSLSPYGEWIEVGDYGLCWRPNDVGDDWAPYTDGYWSYTDAGWTWVSYEDFGAVAYHYGRWVRVEDEGWCWVPDYEWGPAWVSWRNNDNYIGWAPLPPEARWEPDRGFSVWVDTSYDIGPSYYNFCAVADFGAPVIREVIIERPRNFFIIGDTVNITNITINRGIGVPFCGGPRFDFVRDRVRRPIPALKLVRETNITNIQNITNINKTVIRNGGRGGLRAAVAGNQLIVPAPKVRRLDRAQAIAEFQPKRKVAAAKVTRGWQGAQDENQRRELRQRLAKQAEGRRPDNAPAKPVEKVELTPVPVKGDPNAPSPVVNRGPRGDRPGRNNGVAAGTDSPARPGRPEGVNRPDRPNREDRPGNGGRADQNEQRDRPGVPGGVAGRETKPFNGGRGPDKEKPRNNEAPALPPPSPTITATPVPERGGKPAQPGRERPERAEREEKIRPRPSEEMQRQAGEDRKPRQPAGEAEMQQQRARRQQERNEAVQQAQQERARQREAAADEQRKREAATARQQEAAQQELRQQRRQQQEQSGEAMQRRQQRAAQEDRQQQAQALQRQQAARQQQQIQQQRENQQQQQQIRQQRQMQSERQQQMQRQAERQQPRPQVQQPRPQVQQQRPQTQQQRPQPQQQQQFRQRGGGEGGRGDGRNRNQEDGGERRGR